MILGSLETAPFPDSTIPASRNVKFKVLSFNLYAALAQVMSIKAALVGFVLYNLQKGLITGNPISIIF